MAELAIASAIIGAVSTIAQGNAQSKMLKSQALDAEFRGKSESLAYRQRALGFKQEGNRVLDRMLRTASTINARGAAANLDPFSGSIGALQTTSLADGAFDFWVARESADYETDNATLAIEGSKYNAANLRQAASTAKQMSYLKAAGQLAGAGYQYSQLGGAPGFAGGAAPNDLGASGYGFGMRDDTWGGYGTPTMDDYSFLSGHQYKHSTRNWTLY